MRTLLLAAFSAFAILTTAAPHNGGPNVTPTTSTVPRTQTATISTADSAVEVVGVDMFGLDAFLGIPFAEPPTGALRFAPPRPAQYTSHVNATTPPPACLQDASWALDGKYGQSEDCLMLNILAPPGAVGNEAGLPVMVFIYGGAFFLGSATDYFSPPLVAYAASTERPVVLVTIAYRLGIFGWGYGAEMAANGAANLGLRDQIMALEWVRDHIGAFGGDPHKVTVFGQSAGAISISLLMLNEDIDLFRGAILQSGGHSTIPLGPTAAWWNPQYEAVTTLVGCANTSVSAFECLKTVPGEVVLNATIEVAAASGDFFIDGDLIPDSPHKLVGEGKFARIPVITGCNKDEGTLFIPTTVNTTEGVIATMSGFQPVPPNASIIERILAQYPPDPALGSPFNTGNKTFGLAPEFKQAAAIFSDAGFHSHRRWFLRRANEHRFRQTWTYEFEGGVPEDSPAFLGVFHGAEIPYVLGAVDVAANYTAADVELSRLMMDYWINFAHHLNPNGHRTPKVCKSRKRTYSDPDPNPNPDPNSYPDPDAEAPTPALPAPPAWCRHSYPRNKNSLLLRPGNGTMPIQDDFREERIGVFFEPGVASALSFKRAL